MIKLIKTLVFDAVIEGIPLVQGYFARDGYYSCYYLFQRAHKADFMNPFVF